MLKTKIPRSKMIHTARIGLASLLPITAILFTSKYLFDSYEKQNRTIEILFDDASGISNQRTNLIYKGVAIGTVKDVSLSKDHQKAIVKILVSESARELLVEHSKFVLIKPKVSWQGIAGLDTLVSGSYIELIPNKNGKDLARIFQGNTNVETDTPTSYVTFKLITEHSESVSTGDALYHRGMRVGQVLRMSLNREGNRILIDVGVEPKYSFLVRQNTVFWKKQGIQADLSLFGSSVRVNSLETIMHGGIEFATPSKAGPKANLSQTFALETNEPKDFFKKQSDWSPNLRGVEIQKM